MPNSARYDENGTPTSRIPIIRDPPTKEEIKRREEFWANKRAYAQGRGDNTTHILAMLMGGCVGAGGVGAYFSNVPNKERVMLGGIAGSVVLAYSGFVLRASVAFFHSLLRFLIGFNENKINGYRLATITNAAACATTLTYLQAAGAKPANLRKFPLPVALAAATGLSTMVYSSRLLNQVW
eukprot:m.73873 g.73873  ORF g.73873 m.73873 type:complete len:181 (-) comp12436_c0_seq7:2352-2894(-)